MEFDALFCAVIRIVIYSSSISTLTDMEQTVKSRARVYVTLFVSVSTVSGSDQRDGAQACRAVLRSVGPSRCSDGARGGVLTNHPQPDGDDARCRREVRRWTVPLQTGDPHRGVRRAASHGCRAGAPVTGSSTHGGVQHLSLRRQRCLAPSHFAARLHGLYHCLVVL